MRRLIGIALAPARLALRTALAVVFGREEPHPYESRTSLGGDWPPEEGTELG